MMKDIVCVYFHCDGVTAHPVGTCGRMYLGRDGVTAHPTRHCGRRLSNVAGNCTPIMSPV